MGYGREFIRGIRGEVGFQRHEEPSDFRSVVFVYLRENRQGRMKKEQPPGPVHLSGNRNMSEAEQRC